MEKLIITEAALTRRMDWIKRLQQLSGSFSGDVSKLEEALAAQIRVDGVTIIVEHLRLCGCIPECYAHDSTEEKLYSKYTDIVLAEAFKALGLQSLVLKERADAADVEVFASDYSFVADAKAFRLSRTAKNQKDFKVQAMDTWKRGKPYAMVVCPIYQLPVKTSQIYQQASVRNVCIFTYSHLAVLVGFAESAGLATAEALLHHILQTVAALNPSKDASAYWFTLNREMLRFSQDITQLWQVEKQAAAESLLCAKAEALRFLAQERENIMRMSHAEALQALLSAHRLDNRTQVVQAIADNGILGMA